VVYIGISNSVDFIWDFPIVIGKPIHFRDSWLDPPVFLMSPYHNPRLDSFQIFYTLLTSLNVRISRRLEQFHSLNLAKSAQVTSAAKDDWSRADMYMFSGSGTRQLYDVISVTDFTKVYFPNIVVIDAPLPTQARAYGS
jgi:hypothetical protein